MAMAAQPACAAGRGAARGRRQGDRPRHHLRRTVADPAADAALAAALGPDVVLAGDETLIQTPQADQTMRVEPLPQFIAAGAKSGIASVVLDRDGTLRRVPRYPDGFAARARQGRRRDAEPTCRPARCCRPSARRARSRRCPTIRRCRPTNSCRKDFFRGRVVIVGLSLQTAPAADAGGAEPSRRRSRCAAGIWSSGAEIQATIFDNITRRLFIAAASPLAAGGLHLAAALLAAAAVWRGTGWLTAVLSARRHRRFVAAAACCCIRPALRAAVAPALAFVAVAAPERARLCGRAAAAARHHPRLLAISLAGLVERLATTRRS